MSDVLKSEFKVPIKIELSTEIILVQGQIQKFKNKLHTPEGIIKYGSSHSSVMFSVQLNPYFPQAGAELESRDKKGWTALFHATYSGHQNMVRFLLENGANAEST